MTDLEEVDGEELSCAICEGEISVDEFGKVLCSQCETLNNNDVRENEFLREAMWECWGEGSASTRLIRMLAARSALMKSDRKIRFEVLFEQNLTDLEERFKDLVDFEESLGREERRI